MISQALRLNQVEEYYFSKKLQEVRELQASGRPIINLGIGSPDLPPPSQVLEGFNSAFIDPVAHQYQPYRGTADFRKAIREFYLTHYNVDLDHETQVLPLMGSKEGIMHVSMAFLNEGDEVLIPNPGYPTYSSVTQLVGATAVPYELTEEHGWLPGLAELEKRDLSKVKLMWVNYPHMPTGATAGAGVFKDLIAFAKRNQILIVNDNPYSFILNKEPCSILKEESAMEVVLELNSLSKTFNMAGWRIGMLCGSKTNLDAVLKVKTNMDSGMFFPLQAGAAAALRLSSEWFSQLNEIYARRKKKMLELVTALGCSFSEDQAGLFIWAKVPNLCTSEDFVSRLLYEKEIFIAPGFIFGSQGEGYVRFSLCASEENIENALRRVRS